MNIKLTIICVLISLNSFSKFEKGQIVTINGKQIDCFIDNQYWEKTPQSFIYKHEVNSEKTYNIISDSLKIIKISGVLLYKRFETDIEVSSHDNSIDDGAKPKYQKKSVLMKCLVNSKTCLYAYKSSNNYGYYYAKENENPKYLIFKPYKRQVKSKTKLMYNNGFRSQLFKELSLHSYDLNQYSDIEYNEKDLIEYFKKYNGQLNATIQILDNKPTSLFNLYVFANSNLLFGTFEYSGKDLKVEDGFSNSIGVGGSYKLPICDYKLSIDGNVSIGWRKSACFSYNHIRDFALNISAIFLYKYQTMQL
jgi:hypothetical protein